MSNKPADFFVGVMDFFAILLPGALLVFLLSRWESTVFGPVLPPLASPEVRWIAFFVLAYISGHFLHHLGAILDWVYDTVYVKLLKRRSGEERLLTRTREIMSQTLGDDANMTKAFSWAGSYVRVHSNAAATELERNGADSKFFRSLTIVLLVTFVIVAVGLHLIAALTTFAGAIFAFWRYADRRWKATQMTYEYFQLLQVYRA